MRPVRIGEHRTRVTVENPATPETYDSFAQPVGTFVPVGTFWCFVRDLQGTELVAAKQVKARASIAVRIRWQGQSVAISNMTRLIIGGTYYGVIDVRNTEFRFRSLVMTCYEMGQVESP